MRRDAATRARLLRAGERLFADRGFRKVTVREICRDARANVAAINYHFGDKLGLYREVMREAIDRMRDTNEAAREAARDGSREDRLRRSIHILVTRVVSGNRGTVHRLIQREVADPTPALDVLVEEGIRPRIDLLAALVADLIGASPSDPRVLRSVASIQTQMTAYFPHPIAARLGFSLEPRSAASVKTIADHIVQFSLAGIRGLATPSRRHR